MPESVTDRCTKAHEYIFFLSKSPHYYFDSAAIKEKAAQNRWSGKKPMNLNNTKDTNGIFGGLTRERDMMPEYRNRRSVWTVATKPYRGAHFATFPPTLIEPCISVGAPTGGMVLDPFLGSGTTAAVAARLQRHYIGIELNPAYVKLARSRLREVAGSSTLVAAE
jgi:DNA modification methylase